MKINENNGQIQRDKYSSITSQFAKLAVDKRIKKIQKDGKAEALRLIDDFREKSQKNRKTESSDLEKLFEIVKNRYFCTENRLNSEKDRQNPRFNEKNYANLFKTGKYAEKLSGDFDFKKENLCDYLCKNRLKWADFICKIANSHSSDLISTFFVNLIYGGILTDTANNCGFLSILRTDNDESINKNEKWGAMRAIQGKGSTSFGELNGSSKGHFDLKDHSNFDFVSKKALQMNELFKNARRNSNFVWLIEGKELLCDKYLEIYQNYPEFAFILHDFEPLYNENQLNIAENAKNIMFLIDSESFCRHNINGNMRNPAPSSTDLSHKNQFISLAKTAENIVKSGNLYSFLGSSDCKNPSSYGNRAGNSPLFLIDSVDFSKKIQAKFDAKQTLNSAETFLQKPDLPIKINNFAGIAPILEQILSNGMQKSVPIYHI